MTSTELGHGSFGAVMSGSITTPSGRILPTAVKVCMRERERALQDGIHAKPCQVMSDGVDDASRKAIFRDMKTVFDANSPFIIQCYGFQMVEAAIRIYMGTYCMVLYRMVWYGMVPMLIFN